MEDLISVSEAARELGVDPSRVRVLAAHGGLDAVKLGNIWAINRSALIERKAIAPGRGRPIKAKNAWAILFLAAGLKPDWVSAQAISRLKDLLRMRGLKGLAPRMNQRAELHYFRAHPGEISYILDDPDLIRSGVSAAGEFGLDLVAGREADGYIPQAKLSHFRKKHALAEVSRGEANVVLRVVPDRIWREVPEHVPLPAVALDLLADPDPRSAGAGREALRRVEADLPRALEQVRGAAPAAP
ncbi:MAG: helix-turn-helix domain-containing protein [Solirubrobacterales bacterium]